MTESPLAAAEARHAWSAPGLALALCAVSGVASCMPLAWLVYERQALAQAQWWRVATSHLAHLNAAHWAVNAAALFLLAVIFRGMGPRKLAAVLACSAAAVAAGLWFGTPQVAWYAGLSGALHGLFAAGAILGWANGPRQGRWGSALLWMAGLAKLCWEARIGWPTAPSPWLGTATVTAAHAFGYAGGSFAGCAMAMARSRRSPASSGSGG
jgi:rhomboid family GlyGly-CTERM serine protease